MEKIYETQKDKVRAIGTHTARHALNFNSYQLTQGVSNVSVEFMERLLKEAKVVPAVNQVELHPQVLYSLSFYFNTPLTRLAGPVLKQMLSSSVVKRESFWLRILHWDPRARHFSRVSLTALCMHLFFSRVCWVDPTVTKIAEAHGVHPARILVSLWANIDGITGEYYPHTQFVTSPDLALVK
jgi:hypothetical protein